MKSAWLLLVGSGGGAAHGRPRAGMDFGSVAIATDQDQKPTSTCCPARPVSIRRTKMPPAAASACCARPEQHPDGRCPVRRARRRGAGGDPAHQRGTVTESWSTPSHPSRPHRRQCVLRQDRCHDLCPRGAARRRRAMRPAPVNGNRVPASEPAAMPVVTYGMGEPVRLLMNSEVVDLHRGAGGAYRRRYHDPLRERQRHHDRRLLPQYRLSLHRHRQWQLVEGHAGSAGSSP